MKKSLISDMKMIGKGFREILMYRFSYIIISCLYALFQSGQPFISIYFSAKIIDGILTQLPIEELLQLVVCLVVLDCICTIIMKIMGRIIENERMRLDFEIRLKMAEKFLHIDYEKVEDPEYQRKKERYEAVERSMGSGLFRMIASLPELLQYGCSILWSFVFTFQLLFSFKKGEQGWKVFVCSPIFSVFLIAMILISIFLNMKIVARSRDKQYKIYSGAEKQQNVLNYYEYSYIGDYHIGKDIRIYHQKPMLMKELEDEYQNFKVMYHNFADNGIHYGNISSLISVVISGLVYLFVGLKALAGMFSVGSIVQYVGSINQFVSGFTNFMKQLTDLRANNEAVGYYFDFMSIPESEMEKGLPIEDDLQEIEFYNVSFKYPGTEDYVIRDLSLKFRAGKKVAIVGMNGSGKTTLIKLLCRLYQPTEGKITLNGIDINDYKYADYLELIAVVFQDFKLFAYTLGENVAASKTVDKDKTEAVLSKAGFGERYKSLEKGTDTYLYKEYDENGVDVSGGEAQKIAIARALYKDAPIVILDEPTAALDPISEFEIYSHFNQMVEDKMAIFISHRLSSCRFCDEIVVMDSGELVQMGSHEVLVVDENGKYYELWNAQAQYYKEEDENEEGNEVIPVGMANICQ